jgi:hypothetical protein
MVQNSMCSNREDCFLTFIVNLYVEMLQKILEKLKQATALMHCGVLLPIQMIPTTVSGTATVLCTCGCA